ncbi:MAG: hypothetical protein BHK79_02840 [Halanaerobium sp. MDAL1]|nr:MAG: hypothetical protein BHK79_02840 [Halanaerobium sp. MDAL1]
MGDFTYAVIGFLIMVGIFLLGREIYCWYFKINERVRLLEKNNELLTHQNQLLSRLCENKNENIKLLNDFGNQKEENSYE